VLFGDNHPPLVVFDKPKNWLMEMQNPNHLATSSPWRKHENSIFKDDNVFDFYANYKSQYIANLGFC